MILNLVDRRSNAGQETRVRDWFAGSTPLLEKLAQPVGLAAWSVDLVLVDDEVMVGLNQGFRGKQGITDVLSFSYLEEAGADDCDLAAEKGHAAVAVKLADNETQEGMVAVVGEIVLAPGFVVERCQANGWPVDLEFPLLVVHGLLHILGWDHLEAAQEAAMQDHEEEILQSLNLTHPLRQRS